jgi:hypothetical protein
MEYTWFTWCMQGGVSITFTLRAMELGRLRRHVLRARTAAAEGGALLLRARDGPVREERDGAVVDR